MKMESEIDTEGVESNQCGQYMRGGCGAPYSMASGPTRLDVSSIQAPKFIRKIFLAMGWETEPGQHPDY